jgi:acetyl esterase/lipase
MFSEALSNFLSHSAWRSGSTTFRTSTGYESANSDYVDASAGIAYAKDAFLGPLDMSAAPANPYISPASFHPSMNIGFKGFPKAFITAGGAKQLRDQIRTLKEEMLKDLGEENLKYREEKDGVHNYLATVSLFMNRKGLIRIEHWIQ